MLELVHSKDKKDRDLCKNYKYFNWDYAWRLLKLYFEKCKAKHRLAFYQYKISMETEHQEVIFYEEKNRMAKALKEVDEMQ